MKRFLKVLLIIGIFLVLLSLVGLFFIKKMTFTLTAWEYPAITKVEQPFPKRPNILLLVAEDMSARVKTFGDSMAHTPNINALTKMGVRYPNTFTTAGVCAPSRAALMMGVHQISMGGQHMRTGTRPEGAYQCVPPQEMKAFPELLRRAGYFTFNTSKQDYQFSGTMVGSGPFTIWDAENDVNLWKSRQEEQPFFGMMNFMETHESGIFPPLGHRPKSMMHLMLQLFRSGLQKSDIDFSLDEVAIPPYYPNTPTVRQDIVRHYQNIAVMDAIVGDVMDKLKKDGLLESTIVIWTTDHGDGLPRAKRELYDSGIKVPMVIYWPKAFRPEGLKEGMVDEQLISFVDLAPTLLSLAKTPIPNYIHGRDFVTDTLQRSHIFASRDRIDEVNDRQRAVRSQRFKYIKSWYPNQAGGHRLAFRDNIPMMEELWQLKAENKLNENQLLWFEAPGEERLFDIQNDPFELKDISQDTAYSEDLIEMRQALNGWLSSIEDWSEVSENEMVNRFFPNGETRQTPVPKISQEDNLILISALHNASIGYQIDEGRWQIYRQSFEIKEGQSVQAKAIRYGWEESGMVSFQF